LFCCFSFFVIDCLETHVRSYESVTCFVIMVV
jgi:hypothetical protein